MYGAVSIIIASCIYSTGYTSAHVTDRQSNVPESKVIDQREPLVVGEEAQAFVNKTLSSRIKTPLLRKPATSFPTGFASAGCADDGEGDSRGTRDVQNFPPPLQPDFSAQ